MIRPGRQPPWPPPNTRRWHESPPGHWQIGSDDPDVNPGDGEGPVRRITRPGFLIDRTAVTNAQCAAFVRATGHRSEAERLGWSFVFLAQLWPDAQEATGTAATVAFPACAGARIIRWCMCPGTMPGPSAALPASAFRTKRNGKSRRGAAWKGPAFPGAMR
ncbi:formylglycine-generating enzyme family protein [Pseudooceanicola sp. CBS1P-1]|nr:formylglycine-generating enzyme family protein [Pseudooceanicola endophyticus]